MIENLSWGCVAIIGDVMLDRHLFGHVERISPEAPVPVLRRSGEQKVPGGAANVAVNAAALGCRVELVGLVGVDQAAADLTEQLRGWRRIGLDGLMATGDRPTTTKTRVMSGQQQIVRIDDELCHPINPQLEDQLIQAARRAIAQADVVVCSDYAKGVLSDRVVGAVIDMARSHGLPVIVDPKRADFSAYRGASLVTPNRSELEIATGLPARSDEQIEIAAAMASGRFGGDVLVTRSEQGMSLWREEGGVVHARGRAVEVFDVSGAGDTVVAAVAGALSAGCDMETAMALAGHAAAIVVSKLGTAFVSAHELNRACLDSTLHQGDAMTLDEARRTCDVWRNRGESIVFTNGCFDLLHPGHLALLKAAAAQGDRLVVALNSDASVRRLKGPMRPIQSEQDRASIIAALRMVDIVLLFDEDTPLETIMTLRPDVLVKGADYRLDQVVGGAFVRDNGGKVVLADLNQGYSTSRICEKVRVDAAPSFGAERVFS